MMDPAIGLNALFRDFAHNLMLAQQVQSPNVEDDVCARMAIVGFTYSAPIEKWTLDHLRFLKQRLDPAYTEQSLRDFGAEAPLIRLFVASCMGYLLGLYENGLLTDEAFSVVECRIPGLVFLHSGKFGGLVPASNDKSPDS